MKSLFLHQTPIEGLKVIERYPVVDTRGYLERIFCHEELKNLLYGKNIRQINRTLTRKKGTVRGMHFQHPPHAETKIVTCIKGIVWDVAIDLRKGSQTFLKHHGVQLSQNNCKSYLIPEGFAHGFQALTPNCEILYLHTADYNKEAEGALNALDPKISIKWPKEIRERSYRDTNHSMISEDFSGFKIL